MIFEDERDQKSWNLSVKKFFFLSPESIYFDWKIYRGLG